MTWGKKPKQDSTSPVRDSQVKKIRKARAANGSAHRQGQGGAEIRRTAAIYSRVVDNSSSSELAASEDD